MNTTTAAPPAYLPAKLDGIPAELKPLDQWINWKWARRDGQWTKPPQDAESDDPSTWLPFAVVSARSDRVGFVPRPGGGIFFLDADKARNPVTGEIEPWARPIIERFRQRTHVEVSPTKTGFKIIGYGHLSVNHIKNLGGGRRWEFFEGGKYTTLTGHRIDGAPATLGDCQDLLDAIYAELWPAAPRPAQPATPITRDTEAILTRVLRTDKGRRLHDSGDWKGCNYPSQSEADLGLCNLYVAAGASRSQADDLFRQSALFRDKWDKRRGEQTYGEMTLDDAFDGSVRLWQDDATASGPNEQDACSVAEPPITPDDLPDLNNLPDDAPALKRIISELRQIHRDMLRREEEANRRIERAERRIEAAEQRAVAAEARAQNLSLLQSKTMAAFRSHGLGNEKATGVALAFEIANQQAADPTRTEFPICNARLAEQIGVSESTVAGHTKEKLPQLVDTRTGEVVDLFERKVRYVPSVPDPTTGKRPDPKSQVVYIPKLDPLAMLDVLANAAPRSGKPKNNHGGRADRGRLCPDHPTADVVKRVTYHCAKCDRVLDRDPDEYQTPGPNEHLADSVDEPDRDAPFPDDSYAYGIRPNGQDADSVPLPAPHLPRGNHYRASTSPTYHNADAPPGSIAEAWQHAQPLPGFAPTPIDRYTDGKIGGRT